MVVEEGAGEEDGVLGDDGEGGADGAEAYRSYVDAVCFDGAALCPISEIRKRVRSSEILPLPVLPTTIKKKRGLGNVGAAELGS